MDVISPPVQLTCVPNSLGYSIDLMYRSILLSEDRSSPVFYTNRLFQTADRRGYARMADDEALKTVTRRRMV